MKNYFKGKIITYDIVLDEVKKLYSLHSAHILDEEKEQTMSFLLNLTSEEKIKFICKNIVSFNSYINKISDNNDTICNVCCYVGFFGLVENNFSVIQCLNICDLVLLSFFVSNFITHPDYPENILIPILSEKKILELVVEKEPKSLSLQEALLGDICTKFHNVNYEMSNVRSYVEKITTEDIENIRKENNEKLEEWSYMF